MKVGTLGALTHRHTPTMGQLPRNGLTPVVFVVAAFGVGLGALWLWNRAAR